MLHAMNSNAAGSVGGMAGAPKPPRTKRPPSAGGEQK
jgi:hypothetical protein